MEDNNVENVDNMEYNNMADRRFTVRFTLFQCCTIMWNCFTLILTILCIVFAFVYWDKLTPCFRRQVAVLCLCMIYWQLGKQDLPGAVWEVIQFTVLFWIAENMNKSSLQTMPECLDTTGSSVLPMINTCFKILLISYTVSFAAFFLVTVGVFIYTFIHVFIYARRMRPQGLTHNQLDELEEIEFKKEEIHADTGQSLCSICLVDFEENEKIIKLPICNHCFHNPCIKQWLESHDICPYCRANIRENLDRLKREAAGEVRRESIELEEVSSEHNEDEEYGS